MSNIQSIGANNTVLDDLNLHGYVRLPFKLSEEEVEGLRAVFAQKLIDDGTETPENPCLAPNMASIVLQVLRDNRAFHQAVGLVLGQEATVSRTLFLQKADVCEASDWHQDVTLVTKITPTIPPSFGPVHYKDGVAYVKATEQFLAGFMTARLYLDEDDKDKGAIDIIPGSHKRGRIPVRTMSHSIVDDIPAFVPAKTGEIHFFRPLIVRRSGAIKQPIMRRVIQLEMTPRLNLPLPLEWIDPLPIFF